SRLLMKSRGSIGVWRMSSEDVQQRDLFSQGLLGSRQTQHDRLPVIEFDPGGPAWGTEFSRFGSSRWSPIEPWTAAPCHEANTPQPIANQRPSFGCGSAIYRPDPGFEQ